MKTVVYNIILIAAFFLGIFVARPANEAFDKYRGWILSAGSATRFWCGSREPWSVNVNKDEVVLRCPE